jgi:RNA polymerase sigma factor (sigma-70 family)
VSSAPPPPPTPQEQALFAEHFHLVDKRAKQAEASFRGLVERDDLESVGKIALYRATNRYQRALNTTFENYASLVIWYAMLDNVRVEAGARRALRVAERATAELLALYRDDFNLLVHGDDDLRRRLSVLVDGTAAAAFLAMIADGMRAGPERDVAEHQAHARALATLRTAFARLSEQDRRLLVLIYRDEFWIKEAAEEIGLSESWTRERHQGALARLHKELVKAGVHTTPEPLPATWADPPWPGESTLPPHKRGKAS